MQKKRVCAYARVSTLSDAQEHSLIAQTEYFKALIENNPNWEFYGVYADQKSGKDARGRKAFKEMIRQAKTKGVDLIITKSISRFARNLIDTLKTVRKLREIGVGVLFEKEGINSLDSSSDFMLSIYSTVAESELKSMSDNVKWAARKRFKSGSVEQADNMYGYRLDENNKLIPIPEEAKYVKLVYYMYLNGSGTYSIAKKLNELGVKRKFSECIWRDADISRMLKNEKYAGDALLQKSHYVGFKKKANNGEVQQYYVENDHKGIVSRQDFLKVQEIMQSRAEAHKHYTRHRPSPFSGVIQCGECGKNYARRKNNRNTPYESWKWSCRTYIQSGRQYCPGNSIRENDLHELFLSAYNEAVKYIDDKNPLHILTKNLKDLLTQERELTGLKAKGYISKIDFDLEHNKLLNMIKDTEKEYEQKTRYINDKMIPAKEYNDKLVRYIESIQIKGMEITFRFKNGAAICRVFNNNRKKKESVLCKAKGW